MYHRLSVPALLATTLVTAQTTTFSTPGATTYTVPPGVTHIQIDAAGGQGGKGNPEPPTPGGKGARLVANFAVTPGETVNVVVGGAGGSFFGVGGGGGSSFVYRTPTQTGLLIAAAGGGGSFLNSGSDGSASTSGTDGGTTFTCCIGGMAGTGGNGGGGGGEGGGGGGGLSTDGGQGLSFGTGGKALANGAAGGSGGFGGDGGFGGGGGGDADGGAGGGGGYNGGGGGGNLSGGGGGGSFSASTPSVMTDAFESGDGYVTIMAVVVPADASQVNYASNLQAGDSSVNLSNTGSAGGNLCANVYVFDPSEEMVSCCSCLITPNALQSLSVQADLISNTLSPSTPQSVVIQILASAPSANCNPASLTLENLQPGLRAWGTKLHALPTNPVNYALTETGFLSSVLSPAELSHLTSFCGFINSNGSGFGICKSCRAGGLGGAKK